MSPDELDTEQFLAELERKLQPATLRLTLAYASVFQLVHGQLKSLVLDKTRTYFSAELDAGEVVVDEAAYRREVLDPSRQGGGKPDRFLGSTMWLIRHGAISQTDADRLDQVYEQRHALTHNLAEFLVDPRRDPDPALLRDALAILRKIHTFWIDVELATGGFHTADLSYHHGDVDADEVWPLQLLFLYQCVDALTDPADS